MTLISDYAVMSSTTELVPYIFERTEPKDDEVFIEIIYCGICHADTQQMLDYCAANNIATEVEVISPESINKAFQRVIDNDVHYRFVIDMENNINKIKCSFSSCIGNPNLWCFH